ncbi:phosphomannomutase/phosphoglucomutase [Agrococcus sp. HG114]|uniref:phosphomannomutase/phosphoglucomutase n=1 Tax=Agrococcus sp. HG114 TaxID=2969757 RepID=UPI00215ADB12|nr:phosphomannomutase/phosphoglucomutase [Agrococcus sp. HG114]MCR8669801.1 phosphomannomutase/phosphoglucomutase [Agrococcus sp. HG114]
MALSDIVKAYDVRGLVEGQLTEEVVRALGAAFADEVGTGAPIVIGHDMRPSSPMLAAAAADGAQARGADVLLIGLCSTDGTYFASGSLDAPAMMFTASHNPAEYNGIKFSRAGARGVSLDTGLAAIRDTAQHYLDHGIPAAARRGERAERDVLGDYAAHLRSLVDLSGIRPLKVVVDAANGMGGMTVPAVLGEAAGLPELPLEIVPLYFELDGTFPNHEANPLDPRNLVDLQAAVVEHGADLGLAFDGDADRCFVIDERGGAVSPSAVAAIVAEREIRRAQAAGERDIVVIHNLITSRAVPEAIRAAGATPVRTRVGHSLIKDRMAETGAVFGGEHSAHYYFRDFWGADNGMLAAMHVLATLGAHDEPMSQLAARYTPYFASGEINSTVDDVPAAYTRIVDAFAHRGEFDELDGLTVTSPDGAWWFSVRPSNTEPLLRLNAEAETEATMAAIRDEVLALIRA